MRCRRPATDDQRRMYGDLAWTWPIQPGDMLKDQYLMSGCSAAEGSGSSERGSEEETTMTKSLSQLPGEDQRVLTTYRDSLLQRLPNHLRRLILYGSRARGDAAPDSDIDVAVIVAGRDQRTPDGWRPAPFSDPLWQEIVNAACDVSLSYNVYISPVVLTEDRLDEQSAFIRSIRSEGIEVWRQAAYG